MARLAAVLGFLLVLLLFLTTVVGATNVLTLDGDSVPAGQEFFEGTDPFAADTDDDGLPDGAELREHGTDPTAADTDGDDVSDGTELNEYGTDPAAADTDSDGLDDGVEVDEYGTDPTVADTDEDGIGDGSEIDEYGTDPLVADTDDDGVPDGAELREHGTDPTAADTDGDDLEDGAEVDDYRTDPLAVDSDDDGLDDATEVAGETDATAADTDADGLEDGREREAGTDPTDPDTDGDRLRDGWEEAGETPAGARLPGADPLRLDLYVQVDYGRPADSAIGVHGRVEQEFAEMPIENPDGSTGIAAHVVEGSRTDDRVTYRGTNFESLRTEYGKALLGDREGVYRQVVVAEFAPGVDHRGRALTPGHFTVVDADSERYHVMVHELVHNAVGRLDVPEACPDDPYHHCTGGGWLEQRTRAGQDDYLLDSIGEQIEAEGFAE